MEEGNKPNYFVSNPCSDNKASLSSLCFADNWSNKEECKTRQRYLILTAVSQTSKEMTNQTPIARCLCALKFAPRWVLILISDFGIHSGTLV